jgi:hypothetical protein
MTHRTLGEFVAFLRQAELVALPAGESWKDMIERIHRTGLVHFVDEETYTWFLECLPPKYQTGGFYAFAEGAEPLTLFWRREEQFFARRLTDLETAEFCRLARIPIPW